MSGLIKSEVAIETASDFTKAVEDALPAERDDLCMRCNHAPEMHIGGRSCMDNLTRPSDEPDVRCFCPKYLSPREVVDKLEKLSETRVQIVACGKESPGIITRGKRAKCHRLIDHEGDHRGIVIGGSGMVTWSDE